MAASGAMADFARMPPEKKAMVFIAIGLVLGLLYWKLAYKDLDESLAQARAEHAGKVQKARTLGEDIPRYQELRTKMAKLRELIEKNQTALPSEAEMPAFFETLQRKVKEAGGEIRKWTNGTGEPVESFVRVPVEVEMTGTFLQIKRFFASLIQPDLRPGAGAEARADAEPQRIVSIDNLALTNPTVTNREVVLNAKFTAVTYLQQDKSATATKPATGQPAGGARPPPRPVAPPPASPASSAPPLPSAATPAGAKVRTETSIDKGDARNRNAGGVDEAKGSARLKGGL
jgi:type IV pilus assembly protein PilO